MFHFGECLQKALVKNAVSVWVEGQKHREKRSVFKCILMQMETQASLLEQNCAGHWHSRSMIGLQFKNKKTCSQPHQYSIWEPSHSSKLEQTLSQFLRESVTGRNSCGISDKVLTKVMMFCSGGLTPYILKASSEQIVLPLTDTGNECRPAHCFY